MKVVVLGSGSKGNSTLIITDKEKILIDVGFSYLHIKELLRCYNTDPIEINKILITHTHKDHVIGLSSFVNKTNTKVCVPHGMVKEINKIINKENIIEIDDNYLIDDLRITLIHTSHDAVSSVGFVINDSRNSLVYITDTGYISQTNLNKIKDKQVYIMESNHDVEMLMNGPYPYILKQRVLSDKGHLSNEMAGNYLRSIIGNDTKTIVLAHLSETNNNAEIAVKTINNIMGDIIKSINIKVAHQNEPLEIEIDD